MMMRCKGQIVAVAVGLAMACLPMSLKAGSGSAEAGYASKGYRLRGYQWDAVLRQRWAVFEDAAHPERPLVSELDPNGGSGPGSSGPGGAGPWVAGNGAAGPLAAVPATRTQPVVKVAELVVRSGETVTLWKEEGNVRMQLAAVSEGNAGLGERVQLRVTGAGAFGSSGWQAAGVVRGPGSVEME